MKTNLLFTFTLGLFLPFVGLAVDPPQVKPLPKPGVRPLPGRGPLPGRFPGQQKPQPVKWGEKQIVVTATIADIKQGPTARSSRPFTITLSC